MIEFGRDYEHSPSLSDFIDDEDDEYREVTEVHHSRKASKVTRIFIDKTVNDFDYRAEIVKLKRTISDLWGMRARDNQKINQLLTEKGALQREMTDAMYNLECKNATLRLQLAESNKFIGEKEAILVRCDEVRFELHVKCTEIDLLQAKHTAETEKLQLEIAQLQSKLTVVTTELQTETAQKISAHALLGQHVKEMDCLTKQHTDLRRENATLSARVSALAAAPTDQFDSLPLEACNGLLSQYTETVAKLHRAVQAKTDALSLDSKCVVCYNAPKKVVLQPCLHLALCKACAVRVKKCPLCRSPIAARLAVQGL